VEHGADGVIVEQPGIVLADHAHGLATAEFQRLQHAEELVHISQPAPAVTQIIDVCGDTWRFSVVLGQACDRNGRLLVRRFEPGDQLLVGIEVGRGPQMHLVHRLARRVEELQAAADLAVVALFHGKAMRPDFGEDAQVDVFAQHHGIVVAGDDLVVDPDLLMHRTFVAGQRHHLADGIETGQKIVDARLDASDAIAAMRRDKLGFRNAELGGKITLARLRIVGPRPPDFMRRRFHALVHGS